jgi:hypothetical protein
MTDSIKREGSGKEADGGLVRGGLGLLSGLVLCGVALMAQAALLQAIAGPAKKAS